MANEDGNDSQKVQVCYGRESAPLLAALMAGFLLKAKLLTHVPQASLAVLTQ